MSTSEPSPPSVSWRVGIFPSGSVVVNAPGVGIHFRVNPPQERNDLANRPDTARALKSWLNGGRRSWLLTVAEKLSSSELLLQSGISIEATAVSKDARDHIAAERLITALLLNEVPEV